MYFENRQNIINWRSSIHSNFVFKNGAFVINVQIAMSNPLCGHKQDFHIVTLEGLCWCRISLSEVSAVLLSSLCPSSGKPIKRGKRFNYLWIYGDDSTWSEQSSSATVSTYSVCVVVEDNKVAVADVEAWEMVARVLCVENVFIDHVGSSSRLRGVSSTGAKQNTTQLETIHQRHTTWRHCLGQLREYCACAHQCLRSDLTNRPIFPEDVIHFLRCNFIGKVPYVQDSVHLWR